MTHSSRLRPPAGMRPAQSRTPRTPRNVGLRAARRRLARRARRQFGTFTLAQAQAEGVSPISIYRGTDRGVIERLWPGVFGIAGAPDSKQRRWLAAQLFVGGDAALSHQTAASVYGLDHGLPTDDVHLTVSVRSREKRDGIVLHRSATLGKDGVVTIGPLRVTSAARTLCDLAAVVDAERLRRLVAAAVRQRLATAHELRRVLSHRRRFAGRAVLRRILDELTPLQSAARTEMESLFLRITTRAGIAPTHLNLGVKDIDGVTRFLDAAWLPEGVYVELDSLEFHGTLLDWHDDLRRENALSIAGFSIQLRFSFADLRDREDEVVETIRRALEVARRSRRASGRDTRGEA